ncbi:class I SAM-dependent methyltransferase [Xanthomonas maliensis]|uniref:class I SAM-dependent methyltransferase n=1 Tax=Xanthomonas maliensis TaxID=1321368 RepID=UPI0003B49828|nr:class I SAM-dependent methyltransferase [Xanthomonas maliensis]KAB7769407.1 class I SAM-dependent methyltransferase [Xanthomonas maliensis]
MSRTPVLDPAAAYALWADSYPPHAHNPLMMAEERAMLTLLPRQLRGLQVLDAGCGSGRYMQHALRRGAARVLGVDLSLPMLQRAQSELERDWPTRRFALQQGSLDALPLDAGVADITVSALVIGHLSRLQPTLAELARVTRVGGIVLCSDVHPVGATLGWERGFKAHGRRYAVRHTIHSNSQWRAACDAVGLMIEVQAEPMLDPADIPQGARFDPAALQLPVALVLRMRRVA